MDEVTFSLLCGVVTAILSGLYLNSKKPECVKRPDGEIDKAYTALISITLGTVVTILVFMPKCGVLTEPMSSSVY